MLKESVDFDYVINKVKQELTIDLPLQDNIMDSEKMNKSFTDIENTLNTLYENTRYLEDAIDYCKTFLSIKLDEYSNELDTIINQIEDIRDINKNMGYIDYPVKFLENKITIPDREKNFNITSCLIRNKLLTLNDKVNIDWTYKSCTRKCDSIPYDENLDNIKTEAYRVAYLEEKSAVSGLTESITITLDKPTEVNLLDIKVSNCEIKNLKYVYINGIEEYVGDYITGIIPESRVVTHIKFDLVCTNYTMSIYTIDKDKMSDNIWNKLKDYEYNTLIGSSSKLNAEEVIQRITKKSDSDASEKTVYKPSASNSIDITMYSYMFGIDSLLVKRIEQEDDSYFISDSISIGQLTEDEYIQLKVEHNNQENCGYEYSILDGDVEIPIIPFDDKHVENERLFPEGSLRFIQAEAPVVIKKDGIAVNISLEDAIKQYRGKYSIDYEVNELTYNYVPINNTIRVKAYIRTYGQYIQDIPYIKSICIRKYGGDALWVNKY